MKVTVMGADGFLGRHLVRSLASLDNIEIVAFGRFGSKRVGEPHIFDTLENVEIVSGDFLNRESVMSALRDTDTVFHLISTTTPAVSNNDPLVDIDTNVRGSIELLQSCVESGVKKVIYFSSGGSVYGNIDNTSITETDPLHPISPYAIGKVTVENYLRYFEFTHGLDYTIYRIANPYGPGQNIYGKQGVIPIFMHHFYKNQPLNVFGDGSMVRDYIYIDDLINMIVCSFDKPSQYKEFNLGSGEGHSINEVIGAIEACAGVSPKRNTLPIPTTYVQRSVLSIDRFVNEFGYKPKTTMHAGIERTWRYVKELEDR